MDMKKAATLLLCAAAASAAPASWYWPFGDGDEPSADARRPRLSELMEPASLLIDEATDLAEDGKSSEAVAKYREALKALDEIEAQNADLAKKPEYATLRNKRAYVNATIDSLLLMQVKSNARAVAVSDTTALERKLAEEKAKNAPRARAMRDIASGDYEAADLVLSGMLAENPADAAALNLRAVLETQRGNYKGAEAALDRAISVRPRGYHAYYNMARLILKSQAQNRAGARRYYEAGRNVGGPRDEALEAKLR